DARRSRKHVYFIEALCLPCPLCPLWFTARTDTRRGQEVPLRAANHARGPMIITRSPLRISLGGGGTDLPSYYRKYGGFVIGAAIDKYVYITLHHTFAQELIIKYSRMERVRSVDEVKHDIIREALKLTLDGAPQLEITSLADIPAETGLGSSGSFTTALLK